MGRIALLWLLLTPLWIAFSLSASASKIAFVPPALVVIAVVLHWLHNRFVLWIAGEHEPRAAGEHEPRADVELSESQSPHFRPVATASLVRPAAVALGVGAGAGAAAITLLFLFDRPLYQSTVPNKSIAALAPPPDSSINVQPKAVKSQSFSSDQEPSNSLFATSSNNADANNADANRTAAQTQTLGQNSTTDQPRCNVSLCESSYQSFRASDCTYQPYSGPRQYCAR